MSLQSINNLNHFIRLSNISEIKMVSVFAQERKRLLPCQPGFQAELEL